VINNALEVTVNETFNNYAVGLVWVFARRVADECASPADGHCLPTTSAYDYANQSASSQHVIRIPSDVANGTWNIGVTGSAAEAARVDAQYVVKTDVGCSHYRVCASCTTDPNCGWCSRDADTGVCVAGDSSGR
jgi:hypothetical protein